MMVRFVQIVWLFLMQQYVHVNAGILTGCNGPLGMESGDIKDTQITASHWLYKAAGYAPHHARLNIKSASGSWCSAGIEKQKDQYLQVDLLKNTRITGIATQGRSKYLEYIERFQLLYQRDGEDFFRMYNESGKWKEFDANTNSADIALNSFIRPIIARKIRLYPRGDEFTLYCTRIELYGCKWSHQPSSIQSYTAPVGGVKNGVNMEDSSYDGVQKNDKTLHHGLGKLTDDMYGSKGSLLGSSGSPWVAYKTVNPEITFHFHEKKVVKQIVIHVNNNNNDIKVFKEVDILISNDDVTYTSVKKYVTDAKQRQKIDVYPVVCNLGEVVAKHIKLKFTKQGEWLLISEIVFMTDTYPPQPVVPEEGSNTGIDTNGGKTDIKKEYTPRPVFTIKPNVYQPENNNNKDSTESKKSSDSKGLGFPIILTIALVTLVLAVVVAVVIYKSYKKNCKQEKGNTSQPPQQPNRQKPDNLALLGDERYMASFHHQQPMKQQTQLLPQNGMYFQPAMHQGGYNPKIMMS